MEAASLFSAQFGGKSVSSLETHIREPLCHHCKTFSEKIPVDVLKLSRHGSSHNTSTELIEKLKCKKYIFSTNGSIYYHPSQETIAWVIKRGGAAPELIFNYLSKFNEVWDDQRLMSQFNYKAIYPQKEGITIEM